MNEAACRVAPASLRTLEAGAQRHRPAGALSLPSAVFHRPGPWMRLTPASSSGLRRAGVRLRLLRGRVRSLRAIWSRSSNGPPDVAPAASSPVSPGLSLRGPWSAPVQSPALGGHGPCFRRPRPSRRRYSSRSAADVLDGGRKAQMATAGEGPVEKVFSGPAWPQDCPERRSRFSRSYPAAPPAQQQLRQIPRPLENPPKTEVAHSGRLNPA
jgi:hypothetical protein